MVDSVTTAGNVNDDWEVAVDTGEFDKQLERQEKDRAAKQVNPTSDDCREKRMNDVLSDSIEKVARASLQSLLTFTAIVREVPKMT